MSNEHRERRAYRKNPGRQYTYQHDPLQNHGDASQRSHHTQFRSGPLIERPDPRRTRQLLRQNILASKRSVEEANEYIDPREHAYHERRPIVEADPYTPQLESRQFRQEAEMPDYPPRLHSGTRRRSIAYAQTEQDPYNGAYHHYNDSDEQYDYAALDDWQDPIDEELPAEAVASDYSPRDDYFQQDEDFDSDFDSLDEDEDFESEPEAIALEQPRRSQNLSRSPKSTHKLDYPLEYPAEDDNYIYEYEEDNPSVRPSRKKKKALSRRGLLLGAGAAAVVGAGFAVHNLVPETPALPTAKGGPNIEQQVQNAFNQGMTQGANQARKELLDGLDTIEGFTLDGAIAAAQLTRKAYDVFVSPIIKFGSVITSDFLNGMLNAFKTARSWLSSINQDNETLGAIQNVLESWTKQVSVLPTQLDQITETDLDGAQAYLRVLQQKITSEKAKLNEAQNKTSTPTAKPQPTATK